MNVGVLSLGNMELTEVVPHFLRQSRRLDIFTLSKFDGFMH